MIVVTEPVAARCLCRFSARYRVGASLRSTTKSQAGAGRLVGPVGTDTSDGQPKTCACPVNVSSYPKVATQIRDHVDALPRYFLGVKWSQIEAKEVGSRREAPFYAAMASAAT